MGGFLRITGGFWAILGVANVLFSLATPEGQAIGSFVLMFNFMLFVLPGAIVFGIGRVITKPRAVAKMTRPCPFCAEEIKPAAVLCMHCGRPVEPLTALEGSGQAPR